MPTMTKPQQCAVSTKRHALKLILKVGVGAAAAGVAASLCPSATSDMLRVVGDGERADIAPLKDIQLLHDINRKGRSTRVVRARAASSATSTRGSAEAVSVVTVANCCGHSHALAQDVNFAPNSANVRQSVKVYGECGGACAGNCRISAAEMDSDVVFEAHVTDRFESISTLVPIASHVLENADVVADVFALSPHYTSPARGVLPLAFKGLGLKPHKILEVTKQKGVAVVSGEQLVDLLGNNRDAFATTELLTDPTADRMVEVKFVNQPVDALVTVRAPNENRFGLIRLSDLLGDFNPEKTFAFPTAKTTKA